MSQQQAVLTEENAEKVLSEFKAVEKRLASDLDKKTGEHRDAVAKDLETIRSGMKTITDSIADIKKTSIGSNFVIMDPSKKLMTDKESESCYSVARALRLKMKAAFRRAGLAMADDIDTKDCGYELECSKALLDQGADQVVSKAQQHVGTNEAGGIFMPREVSNQVIMDLKPMSVAMRAGVQTLTGVSGMLSIPKKTSAITGETLNTELPGALTPQVVTFGEIEMRPRPFGASAKLSYLTMRQTAPAVEGILRQDFSEQLALMVDQHVFKGSGQAGQPLGIATIPTADGLNTVSWSGANFGSQAGSGGMTTYDTSLAKLRAMRHECRKDNALVGSNPAWVGEVEVLQKFEITLNRSGDPMYLGLQTPEQQRLLGIPIYGTTNLNNAATSAAFFLFGTFSNVIHPVWGGIEFAVTDSDGTDFQSGVVCLRAIGMHDVAVRYPQAFCLATSFDAS